MPLWENLEILSDLPDDASRTRFLKALQTHFDAEFYLETYPDIKEAGLDPLEHYLRAGWKENRDPSPEFSTKSYLDANPDVAETGDNPFLYHVWTQTEAEILPEDLDLAVAALPETDLSAVGAEEGGVLETPTEPVGPDIAAPADEEGPETPISPSETVPESVVETPPSDNDEEDPLLEEIARLRPAFDADFYLLKNPEVTEAWPDPLEHFVRYGWKEGRDPSPDFSVRYYLTSNPDVAESGRNPFFHYVADGRREGRAGLPPAPKTIVEDTPESEANKAVMAEMERLSEMFDAAFYLTNNPGVAAAGLDPLEHFVRFGWKEGRDPSPHFSVHYYLESNPDVAAMGRNPFLHYVANGLREGRAGKAEE